jgi:hypothetical protein
VYGAASGYSLASTLGLANSYGAMRSHYPPSVTMDRNYPSIPRSNVQNITKGYNDQKAGNLCRK